MSTNPGRGSGDSRSNTPLTDVVDSLALSYSAVLLIFRLLIGILLLLWIPLAEFSDNLAQTLPVWQSQALLVVVYALYCTLLFALASRHRAAQTIGSFIDVVVVTVLVWMSGGAASPFTGLYLALTAITAFYFGLAVGLGHGAVSGLLWGLSHIGYHGWVPWVQVVFAVISPLIIAFLCGVLRTMRVPGILGAERTGLVPGRLDEWIAAQILEAAEEVPRPGRTDADRFLEERGGEAWREAGARAVVVFAASEPADPELTLVWAHRTPDLADEVGRLTIPRDCAASLSPGTNLVAPGSEVGRATTAFFSGWGKGQLAVIVSGDPAKPRVLAIAASNRPRFSQAEANILNQAGESVAEGTSPINRRSHR